jgi:toxin-antitoxin system PIN domain toxin
MRITVRSVDVNVLLHACFAGSPQHEKAVACIEECRRAEGGLSVLSQVATAFVRIATDSRVYAAPLTTDQALAFLDSVLVEPAARIVHPGPGHWARFTSVLSEWQLTRGDVTDAWLAAAAIDARADWFSFDRGFSRFRGLRWIDPAASG